MKLMITILMIAVFATGAMAQQTMTYGWEDGVNTALGTYGNVGEVINVGDFANTGTHSLYMTEDPMGGTPQVFVAWIGNLVDGDEVTASFFSYDETEGASPSSRIWGHYTSNDITDYQGSAGGNSDYTPGTGWSEQTFTWTVDLAANPDRTALAIEFRMYSGTDANTYWCDDVTITAPDNALIIFPGGSTVATDASSFSGVKALYR